MKKIRVYVYRMFNYLNWLEPSPWIVTWVVDTCIQTHKTNRTWFSSRIETRLVVTDPLSRDFSTVEGKFSVLISLFVVVKTSLCLLPLSTWEYPSFFSLWIISKNFSPNNLCISCTKGSLSSECGSRLMRFLGKDYW